jgi:hypothetical protein
MTPSLILDRQGDLLSRCDDARFNACLHAWFRLDLGAGLHQPKSQRRIIDHNADVLRDAFTTQVRAAYAYRVSADMSVLVQHAAAALDESDVFDHDLAPTGAGLVRFDVPLPMQDIKGEVMRAHWLVWGPAQGPEGPVTLVTLFNDGNDPDDVEVNWLLESDTNGGPDEQAAYRKIVGLWNWVGANWVGQGSPLGPVQHEATPGLLEYAAAEGFEPMPTTNGTRYLHALWLMLNQTITDVSEEYPDKPGRKRAERRRIPPRVTVIQLRRTEGGHRGDGESTIEWQHRWVCRGHWAWRRCGPTLDGAQEYEGGYRRRIYIAPYVKGPEGAPLHVTDKVYDLSR